MKKITSLLVLTIFSLQTIFSSAVFADEISFLHGDQINSSNIITDSAGNRAALYEYDPYGRVVTHTGIDVKHRFTGQEADDSTGLYYYNARYMDPQLGRFVTPDRFVPTGSDPQAFNRYSYVRNNPIKYVDPTGNAWFIAAIVGAIIGAIAAGIQSGGNFKSMLVGAGIGFLAGAAGGVAGSAIKGMALVSAIVGGAVGGTVAGGLNAAVYGGDVGQGMLRGAGFGALGGLTYGSIDKFVSAPGFRWETVRVALETGAGGGLSKLSGGDFWEGVAFSSSIAGSKFLYKVVTALHDGQGRDPFWDSSNGKSAPKSPGQDVHEPETGLSNVGEQYQSDKNSPWSKTNVTGESSPLMLGVSRVPGMNGMAYGHDIFMGRASHLGIIAEAIKIPSIAPAIGATYFALSHDPSMMATFETYNKKAYKK